MNRLNTFILLLAAYGVVWVEAEFQCIRRLTTAQIEVLPALMVYAGLNMDLGTVTLLAVVGGLLFDSVSANPLGTTVIPLFAVGLVLLVNRDLILRDEVYAQAFLGFLACGTAPVLALIFLYGMGAKPLVHWHWFWQCSVMSLAGGIFTPILFDLMDRVNRTFNYRPLGEGAFRPDREIKRGRF